MPKETISSAIWNETPEADNPFAASVCYCSGYDVYGEVLKKASWSEYLFLLFQGERSSKAQAGLLEALAIALANPGLRDHSVRAAMNGGVGGSTNAASLMAALAVGAGALGGGREIVVALDYWAHCRTNLDAWRQLLQESPQQDPAEIWPPMEHPPGFDPHGASCTKPVRQVLDYLSTFDCADALIWLKQNRERLEQFADCPLAMSGVAAAAFLDLAFNADQAEMLYLLLRLPGAAVHALEQKRFGIRKYPFFADAITLTKAPEPSDAAG
jgi:citrate synthase